ncbi:hypothetical protein [Mesorhizobium tianshanense]|nr:hypothetical protein [Mesorhizobium tianshanense]
MIVIARCRQPTGRNSPLLLLERVAGLKEWRRRVNFFAGHALFILQAKETTMQVTISGY